MSRINNLLKSQMVRSTFSMMLTTAVTALVGFLFWKLVAAEASQMSVGEATTMIALVSTASLLASSGMQPAILLALSSKSHELDYKKLTHGYMAIGATLAAVISLIGATALTLLFQEYKFISEPKLFVGIIMFSALTAGGVMLDATVVALHKSNLMPVRNILQSIIKISLILPIFAYGFNAPTAVLVATFVGGLLANAYVLFKVTGTFKVSIYNVRAAWATVKNGIWHHNATSLGGSIPPVVTPLIVTAMLGASQSALFSIAWMVGALFFMISPSVAGAVIASTANLDNINIFGRIKQAAAIIAGLLIVPMLLVFIYPDLILGFFGPTYQEAKTLLILLALSAVPDAATNMAVAYLRLKKDFKAATVLNLSMGLGTIILAAVLMPYLQVTSAGWAWLIAQTVGTACIALYIYSRYRKNNKERTQ